VPLQDQWQVARQYAVPERGARKARAFSKASTVIQIENEHFVLNAHDASLIAGCAKQPIKTA